MGTESPEERVRLDALAEELKGRQLTPEEQETAKKWWGQGVDEIKEGAESIRRQLREEDYKLLPLAYIAKHYFNKSRVWLYQRINGYPVRGKVYTLSDSEKAIFNNAVQEISKKIGSVRIA